MNDGWLKRLRMAAELTQRALAEKVGISQNHYSSIETGERRPSPEVAIALGEVLAFDWRRFFEDKEKTG